MNWLVNIKYLIILLCIQRGFGVLGLVNLLSNSVKFTCKGYIKLSIKQNKFEVKNNLCEIIFSVTDTGIGVKENQKENIFKRFEQADDSITRKYGGTGLGLAIVKSLVELHKGEINVKNNNNEGSIFYFNLFLKKFDSEILNENIID